MSAKFWTALQDGALGANHREGSLTLVSGYLSQRPNKDALLQGASTRRSKASAAASRWRCRRYA